MPMPEDARQLQRMGIVMLLVGAFVASMVTLRPEGLKAPAWVAYLGAGVFVVAGATALARARQWSRLADGMVCVLLAAMLAIGLWVALGPGARRCVAGVSGSGGTIPEVACRSAFGLGALVVGVMLAIAVRGWLRRRA
jgi:hypothetical protein